MILCQHDPKLSSVGADVGTVVGTNVGAAEIVGSLVGVAKEKILITVSFTAKKPTSFTAFIDYLCTDQLDLGEGEGEQARRALVLRELAQMYQVPRLELLCAQALQERCVAAWRCGCWNTLLGQICI